MRPQARQGFDQGGALDAEIAAHRCLGHAAIECGDDSIQLLANDAGWSAPDQAAFGCGGKAGDDVLQDQGALVLCECTEHLEQELANCFTTY